MSEQELTTSNVAEILKDDTRVKLAGVDADGMLRGKLVSKKKFLSVVEDGFGFCSVIFGWDMHDRTYFRELGISNKENGYRDILAKPDLTSFRRIPWEDNVPFFLVSFYDPDTREPLFACPRALLREALKGPEKEGFRAMAGGEWCFVGMRNRLSQWGRLTLSMQRSTSFINLLHRIAMRRPRLRF
jgi:glutamine synthetase